MEKVTISNVISLLPLKVKTEKNLFNMRLEVLDKRTYKINYENFFKITTKLDENMRKEFIFTESETVKVAKEICELLLQSKAIEIGEDMSLKGNINIVKAYKVIEKLERIGA